MFFRDARDYQILFLSLFLVLGISTRDWTVRPDLMLTVILSCLVTQMILSELFKDKDTPYPVNNLSPRLVSYSPEEHRKMREFAPFSSSWRSALITGLGLCLLLRGNDYQTMALAGCLAIASKFFLRFRGKHCFNPANFGIICALMFTSDGWVSPGQWGTDWWYIMLFIGTGGIILKKVGRWDTSVTFFLTYTALEAMRYWWLGWSGDVLLHQLSSGSLLLFALFMLTDPRSIPNATPSRLIWSMSIALVTFVLQHLFFLPTAVFWALFILSPFTLLLDYIWKAPRFSWQSIRGVVGVGSQNIMETFKNTL